MIVTIKLVNIGIATHNHRVCGGGEGVRTLAYRSTGRIVVIMDWGIGQQKKVKVKGQKCSVISKLRESNA